MNLENHEEKPAEKLKKVKKHKSNCASEQTELLTEKRFLAQTPFSHSTSKLKITPQNHITTPRNQNHPFILTSKIIKNV